MILLRKFLFPFAVLYGAITSIRNYLYDKGIVNSYSFPIPVIAVGNLSVGGTGKTPQIEYLVRLLAEKYAVATLSRGYKRRSSGFLLADATSDASSLGDESFQLYRKFPNIQVAVDSDRKNGIERLLSQQKRPEVILLDDAFQHRRVKAGFYILLTAYGDLFCDDYLLPTGNLRESRSGAERANCIIVTKCPETLSSKEESELRKKIGLSIPLFFSSITYDDKVYSNCGSLLLEAVQKQEKVLVAGIAKPKPFFEYLENKTDTILSFSDHHNFTESEILEIKKQAQDKIIVSTEKDFVRLRTSVLEKQLYYLPIKSKIQHYKAFDELILKFLDQ